MISVLNRQRQLSGNKPFSFLLLVPFLLLSCGAFKKSQPTPWPKDDEIGDVSKDDRNPDGNDKNDSVPKSDETKSKNDKNKKYEVVYFKGDRYKVPVHKDKFEIAVLLPFHTDASNTSTDKKRADLMLEYYQGMKLAIPRVEQLQSAYHITYYDTDNDTNELKKILRRPSVESADLIIGPTDEDQVRIAAYFARKREIPLFSPITTVESLWSDNPYVFILNPSAKMQAQEFLNYFNDKHNGEKLIIVRDGKFYDRTFGEAIVHECNKRSVNYTTVSYNNWIKWGDYLSPKGNVVLHTSRSKTALTSVVTGLFSKANEVTLVGPDDWMDFSSVDYKQLEKLNITYLSTNKAQIPNDMAEDVYLEYTTVYKGTPSWYTYMGYDQLIFACEALDAFGTYFPMFLENKSIPYSNTDFRLIKSDNCFHNLYLEVFQLREGEILKVQ